MRDAFGGAFSIQIFLIFILIYVSFIAVSLNYAKAFKVKSAIIDYIEDNEGILNANDTFDAYLDEKLEAVIGQYNYHVSGVCTPGNMYDADSGELIGYCHPRGVIITLGDKKDIQSYYKVDTYMGWSLPTLNLLSGFGGNNENDTPMGIWTISGETRLVVNSE